MRNFHIFTTCFFLALLSFQTGLAEEWEPSKTEAVIVGVLEWQRPYIPSFPKELRQDVALAETLQARGVPSTQLVTLYDEHATLSAVISALESAVKRTGPDETLLFYYAGHGVRSPDGTSVQFANYDWTPAHALDMGKISGALDGLQGKAVLMADCCYSGGLSEVVEALAENGTDAVCLTSASDRIPSSGDWTCTMTLIEIFSGKRSADTDNDHRVTLSEAASTLVQCMKYYARQTAAVESSGIEADYVLGYVTGIETRPRLPLPFRPYEWVQFQDGKAWRTGRLTSYEDALFSVQTQTYNQRPSALLKRDALWNFPPRPPEISSEEAEEKARAEGKYSGLLRVLESPLDYLAFTGFKELGRQELNAYRGYKNLPAGYWVYVYPNWYIWENSV